MPVISLSISGLLDIVEHQRTGYLAEVLNVANFAEGTRCSGDTKNWARPERVWLNPDRSVASEHRAVCTTMGDNILCNHRFAGTAILADQSATPEVSIVASAGLAAYVATLARLNRTAANKILALLQRRAG